MLKKSRSIVDLLFFSILLLLLLSLSSFKHSAPSDLTQEILVFIE